jgi:hypothetical protein
MDLAFSSHQAGLNSFDLGPRLLPSPILVSVKYPFLLVRQCGSGKLFLVIRTIFGSRHRESRSLPLMAFFGPSRLGGCPLRAKGGHSIAVITRNSWSTSNR